MTEVVYTAQDLHAAKVAQAAAILADIEDLRASIADSANATVGGVEIWTGGVPPALSQIESMLRHHAGTLAQTFGLPDSAAPVTPLQQRLNALADLRWRKSQTFAYDGVPNAPADSALSAVTGFVVASQIAPSEGATTWKLASGEFRSWTFEQVVAYGIAIRGHIQACFDREEALTALIVAAVDPASIDISTGWPS